MVPSQNMMKGNLWQEKPFRNWQYQTYQEAALTYFVQDPGDNKHVGCLHTECAEAPSENFCRGSTVDN